MSPLMWMKKHKLNYTSVAKKLGMRSSSAKMNVWRHMNGKNAIPDKIKMRYIKISKGEITLADLCKPPRRRAKQVQGAQ